MRRMRFEFKIEDQWIGRFYRKSKWGRSYQLGAGVVTDRVDRFDTWWCLIPCFPLHVVEHDPFDPRVEPIPEADFWGAVWS